MATDKKPLPTLPDAKAKLLEGKKGLIVGIANDQSIAWGCARAFRAFGAEVAVTYLNDKARRFVEPLAKVLEAPIFMPLDVQKPGEMEAVFDRIGKEWGKLDFVVHSIAFSPKDTLQGRVVDVDREGFLATMDISCWTFIRMAHLAEPLMRRGGSLFTMTYYGSQMVVKNYNVMGVAKAALESAVRYIAAELGPKGIRVHAISPGPLATRAASGIPEFDALLDKAKAKAEAAPTDEKSKEADASSKQVGRATRRERQHRHEALDLPAGASHRMDEIEAGEEGSHRVEQQPHPHALSRALGQQAHQAAAGVVAAEDERRDVDLRPRPADSPLKLRVGVLPGREQRQRVARAGRRAARRNHRLRGRGFHLRHADAFVRVENLALQVARVDNVMVDDPDGADKIGRAHV